MINSVYGKTMENLQKGINEKDFLKYTSRPTHITHKNFAKNYAANHEIKPVLTDSLTEDIYEQFFKLKHLFDFSNYSKDSKFFDQANNKVIGKMKDESEGKIIGEFVGLKLKMHSMKNFDGKESNTAKGVNIATEFNEFKDTLFNKKIIRYKMRRIQGKKT